MWLPCVGSKVLSRKLAAYVEAEKPAKEVGTSSGLSSGATGYER
jgi:hypothetical protein